MAIKQDLKAAKLRELEEEQKRLAEAEAKKKAAAEKKAAQQEAKKKAETAARKEADLPGYKPGTKENAKTPAKNAPSVGTKQGLNDSMAQRLGAEKGQQIIENRKAEKAEEQAKTYKEADLPGFAGKAYQQRIEREKLEYLNIKEARDKKSTLEQELSELRSGKYKNGDTVSTVAGGMRKGENRAKTPEDERAEELQREIDALGKEITLAERMQNQKYLYKSAAGAEDFEKYSADPEKEEPEKRIEVYKSPNQKRETETVKGYMTEEERAVYNYYFNKFGEEKAEEFFDSIREDLNFRQAQAIFEGNEGKVLNEYLLGAAGGLESAKSGYQGAMRMLLGDDSYQPAGTYQYTSQMAREDLEKTGPKLPEALGGASLGQIGFDVVNTSANMLPSMILGTMGGGAIGAAAIGASAAGNAYTEMINAGYSKEQATNYSVLVGASEASLGYLLGGIEATGGKLSKAAMAKILPKIDSALARTAANVSSNMVSEFTEEYLQEILEPVFRNIAFMEENEIDLLSEEAIYSGILGALSAGAMAMTGNSGTNAEVPVPFDGKAEPGSQAAAIADKITEIENRPISEAEKAAAIEKVMEVAAEDGTEPGLAEEAEKFREIHAEKAKQQEEAERAEREEYYLELMGIEKSPKKAGQYFFDEQNEDFVINDDSGKPRFRKELILEEARKDDEILGDKSPFREGFEQKILNDKTLIEPVNINQENIIPESLKFSDIAAFVKGLIKNGTLFRGAVKNKYTDYIINVGRDGLEETGKNAQRQKSKAPVEALSNVKEIVEKAVLIGVHGTDASKTPTKNKKPHKLYQYIFACPYTKNGTEYVAIIRADRVYNGADIIRNFYNLKSIEIVAANPSNRFSTPEGNVATITNIAELAKTVNSINPEYMGLKENFNNGKAIADYISPLTQPTSIGNSIFGAGIFGNQKNVDSEKEASQSSTGQVNTDEEADRFYRELMGFEDSVPSFVRADIDRVVNDPSIDNEQKILDLMEMFDKAKSPVEKSEIGRYIYNLRTNPKEASRTVINEGDAERVSAEVAASAKRVAERVLQNRKNKQKAKEAELEENAVFEETDIPEAEETFADVPQSEKSKRIERRYQREVENGIASVFGVSRSDLKGDIRPIIEEISADLKGGKKISTEQINRLYKTAFDDGIIVEEFPQYDSTRRYIRSTPIFVDGKTRKEFGDDFSFRDFARSNFGNMKISSDPRDSHLDSFYKTLSGMAPDMFHEGETDPKTQLEDIADFMQQTKKQYYGLMEVYSGDNLADFEKWAKKELSAYMDDFSKGIGNVARYERDRQIKATNKAREMESRASLDEAFKAFEGNRIFETRRNVEKVKNKHLLNDTDLAVVKRLHEGTMTEADVIFQSAGNVEGIIEVYNAEKEYKQARAPFDRYRIAYRTAMRHDAIEATDYSDEWNDKKIGFEYSRETAERNIRDITENGRFGGEAVISEYIQPVHEHEAMKNRWIREMNQRVKDLELGHMNKYERAYAQMIGENAQYIAEGKLTKHNEAEHHALNEKIENLLEQHGNEINKEKCEKAAAGFMDIYKDILDQWNRERIRLGQEPIGKIEGYFPHFTEAKPETLLQKIFSWFGFDIGSSKLPTDIAGRTADRKPNTKYNPHANRRTSDTTDYDILKGFDGYIRTAADSIYHTEDIQKLRALSDTIRTKYSGAETEKRIEEIRDRKDLSEEDKEALIAEVFKTAPGEYHLSNFVVWLDEYTNILAGKKSRGDREAEYQMGREIYDVSKAIEGRIASNMIGFNLSTPVMNFVPLFQATADISPADIISGIIQTGVSAARGDSYIADGSDFLTNRFGVDSIYKNNYGLFGSENAKDFVAKISDGGSFLMELADRIVSESLVRARFEQNIKKGLSSESAFMEADEWAAGLIADRSLGALPNIFNIKNPVAKALSMFQVEANNQYSYIFKDAGKYKWDKEGAFNTIVGQLTFWAAMAICNGLADELLGRDNVVPDPLGMTAEVLEKLQKGESVGDVALDTATNIVEQIPFVGGLLGGGRVPISAALPDFEQAVKLFDPEVSGKKKGQILLEEVSKPLSYILLPSAAGQLWKTGKGVAQLIRGGAYGTEADGSEYMKFPQSYKPGDVAKTVLFGQYAGSTGQDYIDSGFKHLSAKQTEQMKHAEKWGITNDEFYRTIMGFRQLGTDEEKKEALYANDEFTSGEKGILEQIIFGDANKPYQSRDYSSGEAFVRSGLSDTEKRLHDGGYSESEIEAIENAFKGGRNKGESINYIESKLGFTEAKAFEAYSRRKGEWIDELSGEDAKRAQGAADYYGMSTEEYKTVLNLSKFGAQIKKADGTEEYSTSAENVIPNIAKALGVTEKRAGELYNRVTKYEYTKSDLEPERVKDLETSAKWYGVDEKGYFVARNAIKTAEGEKDKYGKTISGTEKAAAIKEISSMLGIDAQEAAVYYLAAKGELVLSKEDLTSAKRADLEEAMKHGWSELQFFDAVNVIKLNGASKKDDIIRALQDAGATYEMAVGYYNLTKNYDYYKRS